MSAAAREFLRAILEEQEAQREMELWRAANTLKELAPKPTETKEEHETH